MKKIILAGGGTAGHTFPLLEIALTLQKNHRVKLLFVSDRLSSTKKIITEKNIPYFGIITGKRRAYASVSNFFDIFKTLFGITEVFFLFIFDRPALVFAKGGYISFPIVFWAKRFKIPLIIHESDAVMGNANIWASSAAKYICLGFPIQYFFEYNQKEKNKIPLQKLKYTGIPLRKEFFENHDTEIKDQILITGGSQGSAKINKTVSEIIPELSKKYKVYHISGERDFDELYKKFKDINNYHVLKFSEDLPDLMRKSTLVITRAGANTLAEISALKKCAIIIPLESAKKNHQQINAKIYQNANAGVVISEKNLTANSLLSIINRLMEDWKFRNLIGHHAGEFFTPEATKSIIDLIFEVI